MTLGAQEKLPGNFYGYLVPHANVKHLDWGAKGDDSTDDTSAIQAAIDAIHGEGGGIVYIPAGTYQVSTLNLRENVQIIGAGRGATILKSKENAHENSVTGNATGGTASTLVDSAASFTSNYIGGSVEITAGTNAGEHRYITATISTTLIIGTLNPNSDEDWSSAPDATSVYVAYECGAMFKVTTDEYYGIAIRNLTLDGNSTNQDALIDAIYVDFTGSMASASADGDPLEIENVTIKDFTGHGIYHRRFNTYIGNGPRYTNVRIFGCGRNGLILNQPSTIAFSYQPARITDCVFRDNGFTAVVVEDPEALLVNCTAIDNGDGSLTNEGDAFQFGRAGIKAYGLYIDKHPGAGVRVLNDYCLISGTSNGCQSGGFVIDGSHIGTMLFVNGQRDSLTTPTFNQNKLVDYTGSPEQSVIIHAGEYDGTAWPSGWGGYPIDIGIAQADKFNLIVSGVGTIFPAFSNSTRGPGLGGPAGMVIYNSDDGNLNIHTGSGWILPNGTTT